MSGFSVEAVLAVDYHILVVFDGQAYVTNFLGIQGASRNAELYDVVMSMTQQSNGFLDAFHDRLQEDGYTPQQTADLAAQWGVVDSDLKTWLEKHGEAKSDDGRFQADFETKLLIEQVHQLLEYRGAISHPWFLSASEDELRQAWASYRDECLELYRRMVELELKQDRLMGSNCDWLKLDDELRRKAGYIWMCRRRLGEI